MLCFLLHIHACWVTQEEALAPLLAIVARLGTLKSLTILGFEQTLRPIVTEQLLQVVKHNKQMTHLSLEYFEESAFPRLCDILADPGHCLRSLNLVLDARTPQEIEDGKAYGGRERSDSEDEDDDVSSDTSDESGVDESSEENDTIGCGNESSDGNDDGSDGLSNCSR